LQTKIISSSIILVLLFAGVISMFIEGVNANPVAAPLIHITSPENNAVLQTNSVNVSLIDVGKLLNSSDAEFSYVLDGQAPKPLNSTTISLKDLPAGSHSLTIYSKISYYMGASGFQSRIETQDAVYFSIYYSSTQTNFVIASGIILAAVSVSASVKRKSIVKRLKGGKSKVFWAGLTLFIFFIAAFLPSLWLFSDSMLFPVYSAKQPPFQIYFASTVILGITSYCLMLRGTRNRLTSGQKEN
jgi:hypothetical protein